AWRASWRGGKRPADPGRVSDFAHRREGGLRFRASDEGGKQGRAGAAHRQPRYAVVTPVQRLVELREQPPACGLEVIPKQTDVSPSRQCGDEPRGPARA